VIHSMTKTSSLLTFTSAFTHISLVLEFNTQYVHYSYISIFISFKSSVTLEMDCHHRGMLDIYFLIIYLVKKI